MVVHPIPPVFDKDSNILILGSFPSVKSREQGFFYGHPQNRFWKVTAAVFGEEVPQTIPEKRAFLIRNHIAVWDVIRSCDIVGSSDSSIRNVTANDLNEIDEDIFIGKISFADLTAARFCISGYDFRESCRPQLIAGPFQNDSDAVIGDCIIYHFQIIMKRGFL